MDLTPPSIALFHPVFAQMARELREAVQPSDFTEADMSDVSYFLRVCAENHASKKAFHKALQSCPFIGRHGFWNSQKITIEPNEMEPDG